MTLTSEYPGRELEAMSSATNYHRWIFEEFRPFVGAKVAEVGAGLGGFSRVLLEVGLERLYAFEPARNLYPRLKANLASQVGASAINAFFTLSSLPESVDTVVYVNVLEHIEDDLSELRTAHEALVRGGNLLIFVPALSWLFSEADRQMGHFRRYDKEELTDLVKHAGFQVEKSRYFDLVGIVPWYVYFVLMQGSFSAGKVSLYDRMVVPLMRRIEAIGNPWIGKSLLLVARKL
jgi:SAM-dependent methyltransferase